MEASSSRVVRRCCWREMNVIPGPGGKPGPNLFRFMGAVVVHDEVNIQIFRNLPVNLFLKGQKLFSAVSPLRRRPITSPVATSRAANRVVVP